MESLCGRGKGSEHGVFVLLDMVMGSEHGVFVLQFSGTW